MSKIVYLAGPITGLDYAGATDWREFATLHIANNLSPGQFNKATGKIFALHTQTGIEVLSPMRAKTALKSVGTFTADGDAYNGVCLMSSDRGIMTRDRFDSMRCDVLLVNLLGAKKVSIGTVMEIAWADSNRTPIVCAMEPDGNPHEHGMIKEALGFRVPTLEEAILIVKSILLP